MNKIQSQCQKNAIAVKVLRLNSNLIVVLLAKSELINNIQRHTSRIQLHDLSEDKIDVRLKGLTNGNGYIALISANSKHSKTRDNYKNKL